MQKKPMPTMTRAAAIIALAASMPVSVSVLTAQDAQDYSSLASREIIRRQAAVSDGDRLLLEGRDAYTNGDYQQAADKFGQALQKVPDTPMFADRRGEYTAHLNDANIALAMIYREQGRSEDAKALLEAVLESSPDNQTAKKELGQLADPYRTNVALTPEHVEDVQEVNAALQKADGLFELGKFDEAKREYESALRVDPYNVIARRGMERVAAIRSDYYRAAYDQTRAELLSQVDKAWEITVPQDLPEMAPTTDGGARDTGVAYIQEKLRRIIIPSINFEDTTVEDAIGFLRQRAAELDTMELDPTKKGVNFVIRKPRNSAAAPVDTGLDSSLGDTLSLGSGDPSSLRIPSLNVRNVPLAVALRYICDATKLRYKVDDYAVTLVPQTETGEDIFSRTFTVPPDFSAKLSSGDAGGGSAEVDPFADAGSASRNLIEARKPIDQLLKGSGIVFPEGASATLTGSVLIVSNTPTELDKVEQLVEAIANDQPKQVKITTKFVEVTQENGEELGFDWVIGPFSSGDGNLVGAGGTIGSGGSRTGFDFTGPTIPGVTNNDVDVRNIMTAGNRSGNFAISGNNIDSILNNTNRAAQSLNVAPGIMSMTGLFSEGQLKVIMRGLSQKKGIDLMTAPSITARSGEKATIEIIREFIYPTEYDPPELPGGGGGGNNGGSVVTARIVTPANPTAFETRNTGVTLEIEPNLGENNFMIDLRFVPEIVEFEGFVNYGSPIFAGGGIDFFGNEELPSLLTENRIEMPVFSTRRVNTALTIYDGYTVAIGGLMREDVQNVEDKVPLLGDIPFIGRLFQTKAENRIKSNLILFVTAQIIDPTGRPLRGADSEAIGIDSSADSEL